ncbi:MAG: hypothetical protein FWC93_05715, partial [Defluviitaleaceae bacterium]|nr:hypothetical protein [Defluviitaleaceae bacterium]
HVTVNRIWNNQGYVNMINVNKNAPWQRIYFTAALFGQEVNITLINNRFFTLNAFNNGNDNNASLANLGVIRIWPQLNGANANVPYANLAVTAVFPNGQCAMDVVRVNRIWNNPDFVNMIDVDKTVNWERIYFTATLFGQTIELTLINNRFVPPPTLTLQAFNNGNENNPGLAQAGVIRIWTQLNGANTPIPYEEMTVTATLPDGTCVINLVRINNMWANPGYVNMFDVTKTPYWQYINFTVGLFGQSVELLLVNTRFVEMPA